MKNIITVLCVLLRVCIPIHASDSAAVKTLSLKDGETAGIAKIEDLEWLAGSWKGEGLGGITEEFWTKPSGGSMTGLFKLVKDGKTVFQELIVIQEQNNSLVLKLKHFNADLTGWEEKDKTIDFPLVRVAPNEAFFDGLTYRKMQNGSLQIFLKLRQKDGQVVEEEFRFSPM